MLNRARKVILLGLQLFALAIPAAANTNTKSIDDYWRETGITTEFLKKRVSNENCYTISQYFFLGCIRALEVLAQFQKPESYFLPPELAKGLLTQPEYDHIQTYGAITWIQKIPANGQKTPPPGVSEKRAQDKAWHLLYQQMQSTRTIDFDDFLAQLAGPLQGQEDEAVITARAINQYLAYASDLNTAIWPKSYYNSRFKNSNESLYLGSD